MKKYLLLLSFWGILSLNGQQTHYLNNLNPEGMNYIFGNSLQISPGDTIKIPAGTYGGLRFYDINGLPDLPVVITNHLGKVLIKEMLYSAMEFHRSTHLRITGTGSTSVKRGIEIMAENTGAQGINITNFSSDIELDHLKIAKAGFAGIMAKTDPNCNDSTTHRDAGFVMQNIHIHDNIILNTLGEGVYIGYTGSRLYGSNLNCSGTPVFAHWNENIVVENNRFSNIGLDAIQLNLVRQGGVIRGNWVSSYATKGQPFQDYAMSVGTGDYQIFNNNIINEEGEQGRGIQFLSGFSGSKIFNNLIVNPKQQGLFIHMRNPFLEEKGYVIANNTIVNPELSGIFYNTIITDSDDLSDVGRTQDDVPTLFANNLIINPGNDYETLNFWKGFDENYIDFNNRSTRDGQLANISNNYYAETLEELSFVNVDRYNFRPDHLYSPLVDAGTDLVEYGITMDLTNKPRPSGNGFDIGAFEFRGRQLNENQVRRLDKRSTKGDLLIVPNPVFSTTSFSLNDAEIQSIVIFNETGHKVYTIGKKGEKENVDLSFLPMGNYFVRARTTTGDPSFGILLKQLPVE